MIQAIGDEFVTWVNNSPRQKSKAGILPHCAPNYAYQCPSTYDVLNKGITLNDEERNCIRDLIEEHCSASKNRDYIPEDFRESVEYAKKALGIDQYDMVSAWRVFKEIREYLLEEEE